MTDTKTTTLMLIDDDQIEQMMHQRIIRRCDLVHTVLSYQRADEALDYLRGDQSPTPDIILLDINMPRMDGFEFLQALSELPADIRKPAIVMLTTSLNPNDKARAEQFDLVKGYLTKPLTLESLRSIIIGQATS